jgi:hypothetical protein
VVGQMVPRPWPVKLDSLSVARIKELPGERLGRDRGRGQSVTFNLAGAQGARKEVVTAQMGVGGPHWVLMLV